MKWMHSVNLASIYVGVVEISKRSSEVITKGFVETLEEYSESKNKKE